jgi:cytochrome b561
MIEELRAWTRKYNEQGRYSPIGQTFHWTMAALILFQLGWGLWTDWIMPGGDKIRAYQIHSAAGLPVLLLGILRFLWRVTIPSGVENDADELGWQTTFANVTHWLFYIAFFGLPLSGWLMWSSIAQPGPLYLAGVLPWPQLPLSGLDYELQLRLLDLAEDVHHSLVILLLALVPAHAGAALKHHFWDRHDVLTAMLPQVPDWEDRRADELHRQQAPAPPKSSGAG